MQKYGNEKTRDEMLENLVKGRNMAMKRQEETKKRNIKISYMKIMHKEWQKLYPNSTHSAKNLQFMAS